MKKSVKTLLILLTIITVLGAVVTYRASYRSDAEEFIYYQHQNPFISLDGSTQISAHRSGGGIAPEESLAAFKNCVENSDFSVDVFEFDLHITKDDVLILLHDDTLDRTTDSEEVLGVSKARPEDYTYEELRQLNIGAHFTDKDGHMPYAAYSGNSVPEDLRILRVDDILDYLESHGHYNYIIELKNGGELGKKGVDILYNVLKERNLLDDTVFGTFHKEVSAYVDEMHPDLPRSASIPEVVNFYFAARFKKEDLQAKYTALQIPFNMPYRLLLNLGTTDLINYAHKHDIAVQYWTINKEEELRYLMDIGADCIMTDYPDLMYSITNE